MIINNPVIINNVIQNTLDVTFNNYETVINQIVVQQNVDVINNIQINVNNNLDSCASSIIAQLQAQLSASFSLTVQQQADLTRIITGTVQTQVGSVKQGLPTQLGVVNQNVPQQTTTLVDTLRTRLTTSLQENLTVLATTQNFCPAPQAPAVVPSKCVAPPVAAQGNKGLSLKVACRNDAGQVSTQQCLVDAKSLTWSAASLTQSEANAALALDETLTQTLNVDLRNSTAVTQAGYAVECVTSLVEHKQVAKDSLQAFAGSVRDALLGRPTLSLQQTNLEALIDVDSEAMLLQSFLPGAQNLTAALIEAPELMPVLRQDLAVNATSIQTLL